MLFPMGDDLSAGARTAILATTARGGTALYNGTYLALKEMTKLSAQHRRSPAASDCGPFGWRRHGEPSQLRRCAGVGEGERHRDLHDLASIEDGGLPGSPGRHHYFSQSDFAMKTLAQETGAKSYFPTNISELAGVYSSIAEELASQYALGYTSKNPKKDGGYRRVIVRVTAQPGVRTRTRNGYLAARNR